MDKKWMLLAAIVIVILAALAITAYAEPQEGKLSFYGNGTSLAKGTMYNTARNYGFQVNMTNSTDIVLDMMNATFESNFTGTMRNYTNRTAVGTILLQNISEMHWINFSQISFKGAEYVYRYRWLGNYSNGTDVTANATQWQVYNIARQISSVTLELNGTQADKAYSTSTVANMTAAVNVSGGIIKLDIPIPLHTNKSGSDRVENVTTLPSTAGAYPITASFTGDPNNTISNASYRIVASVLGSATTAIAGLTTPTNTTYTNATLARIHNVTATNAMGCKLYTDQTAFMLQNTTTTNTSFTNTSAYVDEGWLNTDGSHWIIGSCWNVTDDAVNSTKVFLTLDTNVPLSITAAIEPTTIMNRNLTNGTYVNSNYFYLNITTNASTSMVWVLLDDNTTKKFLENRSFANTTWSINLTGKYLNNTLMTDGTHYITIYANDSGNAPRTESSSANITFFTDTVSPKISSVLSNATQTGNFNLTFTFSESNFLFSNESTVSACGARIHFYTNESATNNTIAYNGTAGSASTICYVNIDSSSFTMDGQVNIAPYVYDMAGNQNASSIQNVSNWTTTKVVVPDGDDYFWQLFSSVKTATSLHNLTHSNAYIERCSWFNQSAVQGGKSWTTHRKDLGFAGTNANKSVSYLDGVACRFNQSTWLWQKIDDTRSANPLNVSVYRGWNLVGHTAKTYAFDNIVVLWKHILNSTGQTTPASFERFSYYNVRNTTGDCLYWDWRYSQSLGGWNITECAGTNTWSTAIGRGSAMWTWLNDTTSNNTYYWNVTGGW